MANSVLNEALTNISPSLSSTRIRGLVWKLVIATLILMAIGSATRVMNAGLACPDWPLCYGQLVPTAQMNLQVFLEWFHRLDASLIGIGSIVLVALSWWDRRSLPQWLPWASTFALFLVVFQGILGALTVTELLRFDLVTAHLGTALLFFSTLIIMGCSLISPLPNRENQEILPGLKGRIKTLTIISFISAIFVYLQSLLGGLVASQWALHQCFGYAQLCTVMHSHIVGVVPASLATLILVVMVWRSAANLPKILHRLAWGAGIALIAQIALGVTTFWFHLQVELLTVSHQAVGAILLGCLIAFTVISYRYLVSSNDQLANIL